MILMTVIISFGSLYAPPDQVNLNSIHARLSLNIPNPRFPSPDPDIH